MSTDKCLHWLKQELPELVNKNIIDAAAAEKLSNWYALDRLNQSHSLGKIILATLGSLLIGLGIILLFAHNWEQFSRLQRTILCFIPLLSGQALLIYSLFEKPNAKSWLEGSALFTALSAGACIALISQTYHLGGDIERFLYVWILLIYPLIYVSNSVTPVCLQLFLIMWWQIELPWRDDGDLQGWLMLLALVPFVVQRIRQYIDSGMTTLLFWLLLVVVNLQVARTLHQASEALWLLIYGQIACSAWLLDQLHSHYLGSRAGFWSHPLNRFGTAVIVGLATIASFDEVWSSIYRVYQTDYWQHQDKMHLMVDHIVAAVFILANFVLAFLLWQKNKFNRSFGHGLLASFFAVFLLAYLVNIPARAEILSATIMNIYMLALGGFLIRDGLKANGLASVNLGLMVITLLIGVRFFDSAIPFTIKGIIFILIGASFIAVNTMIKKQIDQQAEVAA